ncbi:MAG TPA: lactate utilization protein [Methylomirabilota bacterium]|nr:lactate utilization protein [Methylomirabilota bacterium]
MSTKAEFLARIREQVRRAPARFAAETARRPQHPAAEAESIRRELAERWPETLDAFRREFEGVAGVFHRVASIDMVPDAVTSIARERDARGLVTWHAAALGADLVPALGARGLDVHQMPAAEPTDGSERERLRSIAARVDLGLTGVDLAVAETGTLVLVSGAGRPRSTSLLPPCHIAVFDRTALLESLRQVGVFLEAWHADPASARGGAINFITGPSRTADIELTLTRGVHGPKEVHAIFVDQPFRG